MAALVIVDQGAHPSAVNYYRQVSSEPIVPGGNLAIGTVVALRQPTFESVLQTIIRNRRHDSVILVCHASSAGVSIPMTVAGGRSVHADVQILDAFMADQTARSRATALCISEAALQALAELIDRVRDLQLDRFELRGCNVGQQPSNTLEAYRLLLGTLSVGGPQARDVYFPIPRPSIEGSNWSRTASQPRTQHYENLLLRSSNRLTGNRFHANIVARDQRALSAWLRQFRPRGSSALQTGHGLWVSHDHRHPIILPFERAFRQHLASVSGERQRGRGRLENQLSGLF